MIIEDISNFAGVISELVVETLVLKQQVVDWVLLIRKRKNDTNITHPIYLEQYTRSAYFYSFFYVIGLLCMVIYSLKYLQLGKRPTCAGTLVLLVCGMPLMISEMFMLKSSGEINWDNQRYGLTLQISYCINAFIQIYWDICDIFQTTDVPCWIFMIFFVYPGISFLLVCCIYAPVMWAMAGWHWFNFIHISDIVVVTVSENAQMTLDIFMVIGHIGQFTITAVITVGFVILYFYVIICFVCCFRRNN